MITRRNMVFSSFGAAFSGLCFSLPAFAESSQHVLKATGKHGKRHSSKKVHYSGDYSQFLMSIRSEALSKGYDGSVVEQALNLSAPNEHVLQLDRHQPEFTMTWAQYRQRVLTPSKLENARSAYLENQGLINNIVQTYPADPGVILGIWGVESAFGKKMGTFHVIDALATLAYAGRRTAFFHSELMKALQILSNGDISTAAMFGSYAGAMGQPQFMPSAYLRYAVDFDGDGRRNIWTSRSDSLASVANYLAKCGWRSGEPWGEAISVPENFSPANTGRKAIRPIQEWLDMGIKPASGESFRLSDGEGAVIMPDGMGGDAFLVYHNFNVIRRYNPSDFYSLGVGLMGDSATTA